MYHARDAGLYFHKRAEVRQTLDLRRNYRARGIFLRRHRPGVQLRLFQTK